MQRTADKAALDQWYCIEQLQEITVGRTTNRLLGTDLAVVRTAADDITGTIAGLENPLPTRQRYGCLWTTLGTPATELLPVPEADETDRRVIVCGATSRETSGLDIGEN